jgi:hypothetical protein
MKTLALALGATLAAASLAQATTIFSDNFNAENGGSGVLNYNSFAQWNVNPGTVDLIGNGFFDFQPGNGLYVDLDGSTNNAGLMTSNAFTLVAGQAYQFSFRLAGNLRGAGNESVAINIAIGHLTDNIIIGQNATFSTFTYNFTALVTDTNARITFQNAGGDNQGALLDDVNLVTVIPTPMAAGMALVGLGLVARRRRTV